MAKKSDKAFDGLPTYSESIANNDFQPPSLRNNITTARTTLISELVTTKVIPDLHSNALSGLSNSTILIIPSNVSSLQPASSNSLDGKSDQQPTFPGETVVSFPSTDNLTLLRLQGPENNLGFLSQPAVVSELEQQMRSNLRHEGYRLHEPEDFMRPKPSSSKKFGFIPQRHASDSDWRTVERAALASGEARVEARMQEICLRIENEMGLYETRTGKAIVLKVEIGA